MRLAAENPKRILLYILLVLFWRIFSSTPQVNALKPCCRNNIPNKNMATPAAISLKFGLIQNPYVRINNIVGRNILLKRSGIKIKYN